MRGPGNQHQPNQYLVTQTSKIAVDPAEHRHLMRIAQMVKRLKPVIEAAGIPESHFAEWMALGEAFEALEGIDWVGPDQRITELQQIRDQTRG